METLMLTTGIVVVLIAAALAWRVRVLKMRALEKARINEAADKLTPQTRKILGLHLQGYTYLEIAGYLGIPKEQVFEAMSTAFYQLGKEIEHPRYGSWRIKLARFMLERLA